MKLDTILIVDDDDSIRNQLSWGLAGEYEVHTAGTAEEARRVLREEKPAVVTLDVTLGTAGGRPEGLVLLDEVVENHPLTRVIMVTGSDSRENALTAIRRGAVDWYARPIQLEELRVILRRALHIRAIELAQAESGSPVRRHYHRIVGESDAMRRVVNLVQRVAPTDATVLVLGEKGTGKELVAHAIHQASGRREAPFVPIHCGAIPGQLMESELFGHERGAFTDAYRKRVGKLELADKGTLFLDEIGDLPTHLQVKLLRFLQERTVERVGGRESLPVDVRVVAATHRDLRAEGRFRGDLLYRLSVVTILLPPLRDRGDDLRLLAEYFLEFYGRQHKRRLKGFTPAGLRALQAHPWPGNVRELENRVQRAVCFAQDVYVWPEDLQLEAGVGTKVPSPTLQAARDEVERRTLIDALTRNAGNVTRAAKDADMSRPTLHHLMRKHGLDAACFRGPDLAGGDDPHGGTDGAS